MKIELLPQGWKRKPSTTRPTHDSLCWRNYWCCLLFGWFPDCSIIVISQVSHHPTLIACHCEGRGWRFWADSNLKTRFWGQTIQLDPLGILTLEFEDGERFQWSKVQLFIEWFLELTVFVLLVIYTAKTSITSLLFSGYN